MRPIPGSIDVPIIIDTILLHFVWVILETSIHFSGIENDFTLDAQSLTLESTWWPHVKSPEINQKSFRFSPASGNESWKCGGGGDPSESPRKSWWRFPRIGWSRVKVNFFNSWSLPESLIRPSGAGKMNYPFSFLCIESFHHGFWCVHLFQLLKVRNQYVSFENSHRIQDIVEEYSRKYFLPKLMDSRLVFRGNRMIFIQGSNWKDLSLKWIFNACVLRTPLQHTRLVIEAYPGTNTFPPTGVFFCFLPHASFVGPSASRRHLFSGHEHGRLRSGTVSVTLTLVWLYLEPSPSLGVTTGRWPSR